MLAPSFFFPYAVFAFLCFTCKSQWKYMSEFSTHHVLLELVSEFLTEQKYISMNNRS